jgi:Dolichyl-phosphate-mannose-protein mannosyltransferase
MMKPANDLLPADGTTAAAANDSPPLAVWPRVLIVTLFVLATINLIWPAYRMFLYLQGNVNEGWNAFFADAAVLRRMPLYPGPDALMTNNYPPVSFFIVGELGRLIHDTLLAGRLLSMAAVIAIAGLIALAIRRLGGSRAGAALGAAVWVATLSNFFAEYVGMNCPQLLAEAFMLGGFILFLRALETGRGYYLAFFVMVFAGFTKHNIISLPLGALLWLALQNPRVALKCAIFSAALIVLGFALCTGVFGHDFVLNLRAPRRSTWSDSYKDFRGFHRVGVSLLAWFVVLWSRPRERRVRFVTLLIVIATLVFLVERRGHGVANNAQFDMVIIATIAAGLAFSMLPSLPLARRLSPAALQTTMIVLMILSLLPLQHRESIRLLLDPRFRGEVYNRRESFLADIAEARAAPGPVDCNPLVCYLAGKTTFVDSFNVEERIAAGRLPHDIIQRRIRDGTLTHVQLPKNSVGLSDKD